MMRKSINTVGIVILFLFLTILSGMTSETAILIMRKNMKEGRTDLTSAKLDSGVSDVGDIIQIEDIKNVPASLSPTSPFYIIKITGMEPKDINIYLNPKTSVISPTDVIKYRGYSIDVTRLSSDKQTELSKTGIVTISSTEFYAAVIEK